MTLHDAIRTIIDESQRLGIEDFEDALSAVSDDLSCGERDDGRLCTLQHQGRATPRPAQAGFFQP
jgi:hypothetical protein